MRVVVATGLLGLLACGGSDTPAPVSFEPAPAVTPAQQTLECDDRDGDGRGPGCDAGPDCDDTDPATFEACGQCLTATEGCPCEVGTKPLDCLPDPSRYPPEFCNEGTRFCRDGEWTDCLPLAHF